MRGFALAVFLTAAAAPVFAEVWVVPEPGLPPAGEPVSVRIHVRAEGDAPPADVSGGTVQRIWKRGRADLDGAEPSFSTQGSGVHLVTFASRPRVTGRGDRVQEFGKSLVVVGAPQPGSPLRWSEVGHRLEIVPQTDPVALLRGESRLELQVLYDREPLAGVVVEAQPVGEPAASRRATTDEIGVARLDVDRAGVWKVLVRHRTRCELCEPPVMERLTSTLVLSVR